jgi:hypothetical protein
MFNVTQLNGTADNNVHIPSDSAVPVLCCCTAVLLHQMSPIATSRSVDRTNVASWTDRPHVRRSNGWKLQTIYITIHIAVLQRMVLPPSSKFSTNSHTDGGPSEAIYLELFNCNTQLSGTRRATLSILLQFTLL